MVVRRGGTGAVLAIAVMMVATGALAESHQDDAKDEGTEAAAEKAPSRASETAASDEAASETPLEDGAVYSESVVVTATRSPQALLDVPVATYVVGTERVETTAADNVGDLLRGTPGLTIVQSNARGVDISARGGGGLLVNSQLAMVDGRSIYLDYIGIVLWDTLPFMFDEIDQVEVQTGPGSAIWGANAINGVINVRTKSPSKLKGGLFRVGAGEKGIRLAGIRYADVVDKNSYKISASYSEQDSFQRDERFPDGTPYPDAVKFPNYPPRQPKLDFRFDHEVETGRTWSYRAGVGAYQGVVHSSIGPYRAKPGSMFGYGEVDWNGRMLDAKVYWNFLRADAPNIFSPGPEKFDTDTWVGEVNAQRAIGSRQLLVHGGMIRALRFDLDVAPGESARNEVDAYVEDQITVSEKIQVNLGVRFDWFDTIGLTWSPRASFIFKPHESHAIRFAYQEAYRAPALVDNFLDVTVYGAATLDPAQPPFLYAIDAVGNPNLDEEHAESFELAYTGVFRKRTTLGVTLFRNDVEDNINFVPTQFYSASDPPAGWTLDPALLGTVYWLPKTLSYANYGVVRDKGVEVQVTHDAKSGLSTTFGYTYQATPSVDNQGGLLPVVVNTPPKHQAALRFSIKREKAWGSLGVTYTDEAFWQDVFNAAFAGKTDSYTLVDGAVGIPLGKVELTFRGTNLLDERAKQHVFGDVIDRRAWAEVSFRWD